jgi:hypothetical protein
MTQSRADELMREERTQQRHNALLRMLGHLKEALTPRLGPLELYRAAALAGYNANPDPAVHDAVAGVKAMWADEDALALLDVGSDEAPA